jgi:hypothetical protein
MVPSSSTEARAAFIPAVAKTASSGVFRCDLGGLDGGADPTPPELAAKVTITR